MTFFMKMLGGREG